MKDKSRVSQYLRILSRSYKEQLDSPPAQGEPAAATGTPVPDNAAAAISQQRRQLVLEVFAVLAGVDDEQEVLQRILHLFKEYCSCDAAGIRLRKGEDYPYIQTIGFDEDFVRTEKMLCTADPNSAPGKKGPVGLECMCGRVISGDLDSTIGSVTDSGAFYCGNISELAAKLAKKNLPFKIRNHCGTAGYRSIALIPIRYRGKIVGLLQLNAHDSNIFSDEDIEFLTVAGQSIGAALIRFQAVQAQHQSDAMLQAIIQNARDGLALTRPDGTVVIYNQAMERMTGYTLEEVNQHGWFYLTFPDAEDRRKAIQKVRLAMSGKIDYLETEITHKDGSRRWVGLSMKPLTIEGNSYHFFTMLNLASKYHNNG